MGDPVCHLHLVDEDGRMPVPRVTLRRAYDPTGDERPARKRVLVDRLWPRGIAKDALHADVWMRDIAPSDGLRRWFGHQPERWEEFRRRYREELREPERARPLEELARMAREQPIVLLYSARDRAHNQAVVIMEALEDLLS